MVFVKKEANALALSKRKLLYGVGVNDAIYMTQQKVNGKNVKCPVYRKWSSMIERCYCLKHQARRPTYINCFVCKEWLVFTNFAKWFEVNNIDGYELDKDIKVKGNNIYSPEKCLFVPSCVNQLLNKNKQKNTAGLPTGVHFDKHANKYRATISIDGKRKYLGYFQTPELARKAYVIAKNKEINRKCKQYPELAVYLISHVEK